ncbi:PLC-like phosphodiesterase [Xylariaceae sp. FL1272]|nr:PLC-like phosphodiesterase [Xylariaceae sp. FL1272]
MHTAKSVLPALALAAGASAACNGQDAYCSRKYSDITFIGTHNSAFVGELPTQNQLESVADQLGMGIRFMTTQTHDKDGTIENCHTSCIEEDAGALVDYLSTVKSFLDANANEVVTLLITNGDDIDINKFNDAYVSSGIDQYAFTPDGQLGLDDWPTLQDLISAGTRLVTFMDYHADTSKVPYILDEFSYFFETPFDPLAADLTDCNVDRPGGSGDGLMILANHNLNYEVLGISLPDLVHASTTNSVDSIKAQVDNCTTLHGRITNVVLVDYASVGQVIDAQNQLNGL